MDVEPRPGLRVPEGWRPCPQPERHWLRGASLFGSDPAGLAQLREDTDRGGRRAWWDLDPRSPRTCHLVCLCEGLESGLTAPLPAGLRRCTRETWREAARGARHGRVVIGPDDRVRVVCR